MADEINLPIAPEPAKDLNLTNRTERIIRQAFADTEAAGNVIELLASIQSRAPLGNVAKAKRDGTDLVKQFNLLIDEFLKKGLMLPPGA
jgi:hypothetical protein